MSIEVKQRIQSYPQYAKSHLTYPAAPVMMAFLPFNRSPRLVLAIMESKIDQRRWDYAMI